MKLRIDNTTPLAFLLPYLNGMTEASRKQVTDTAVKDCIGGDWWRLTTGDFLSLATGDLKPLGVETADNMTAFQYFCLMDFKRFAGELAELLERLTPPQTIEQRQICERLPKNTLQEALLIFNRNYFGLKNFAEAEKIPIFDLLIAKKDVYSKAVYEQEWQKIQQRKYKSRH